MRRLDVREAQPASIRAIVARHDPVDARGAGPLGRRNMRAMAATMDADATAVATA